MRLSESALRVPQTRNLIAASGGNAGGRAAFGLALLLLACQPDTAPQPSSRSEPPFLPSTVEGEAWCRVSYDPDGHASGRMCCAVEWVPRESIDPARMFSGTWTRFEADVDLYPQCQAVAVVGPRGSCPEGFVETVGGTPNDAMHRCDAEVRP